MFNETNGIIRKNVNFSDNTTIKSITLEYTPSNISLPVTIIIEPQSNALKFNKKMEDTFNATNKQFPYKSNNSSGVTYSAVGVTGAITLDNSEDNRQKSTAKYIPPSSKNNSAIIDNINGRDRDEFLTKLLTTLKNKDVIGQKELLLAEREFRITQKSLSF